MKINEKILSEIKHCAKCAMCDMVNHKREYFPDDGSFDKIINRMHAADNKDDLGKAYYDYIINGINYGYSDGHIIGGIMQNEDKNKEFNVNIDSVIEQLIKIKSGDEQAPVGKYPNEDKPDTKQAPVGKHPNEDNDGSNRKTIDGIVEKFDSIFNLFGGLFNKQSENPAGDIRQIESICDDIKQRISSIDLSSCNEEEIDDINKLSADVDTVLTNTDMVAKRIANVPNPQLQQPAVAHTEGAFNIGNFIKQPADIAKNNPVASAVQKRNTVFPHQICGLTDDEIIAEVEKHIRVKDKLDAYPLYDLVKNKILSKKMKELNSKQRPNNPFLTQVDINDYIDIPELLEQYSLCFTMPCNDKGKVIIVLFNPVPVEDKNGILNYPLHIFKATRKNNK